MDILIVSSTGFPNLNAYTVEVWLIDQFLATVVKTSFTTVQTALKYKLWMFMNEVRTNHNSYSLSEPTLWYTPTSNNGYAIIVGDCMRFYDTY